MQKLLYIAPHLSTGGLPQYLVKKIELLQNEYEIYLVEWVDHTGGRLVVQKNKVIDLIDFDKFFTLGEDKTELISIISRIQPDIIHLEEIPEFFMDSEIAEQIYTTERNYKIVETSHDSSYNVENKRFFPDKFMFVSQWQIDQYKDIDIPKVLVEYPIEYFDRPDRTTALEELGLDPNKKHILHVGLYTSRKNQAEFFEYARALPEYEFHSVGNQADNFRYYWEPLMENKPNNVTWWNERDDVERFYQAMDLFLFTSRGTNNDKETMPLVIREAISHQIPVLIYNLEVYQNYFDKFEGVNYLEFNSFDNNVEKIKQYFISKPNNEVFIISTYPNTDSIINTTLDCVKAVQKHGYKVILTSHIPVPDILQQEVDYCVVDINNILTKHTYYNSYFYYAENYNAYINLKGEDNDIYHGPAVYTNYYNGASLASQLGFNKAYFLNYDYILQDIKGIQDISKILNKKDFYFGKHHPSEGDALYTYFFAANPNTFLKNQPLISNGKEYDQLMEIYGAESNGLENLFHHIFKNVGSIYREEENIFESKSKEIFKHEDFSQIEYYTVLSTNKEGFIAPYIRISNVKENKIVKIYASNNLIDTIKVDKKIDYYTLIPYKENEEIKFEIFNNLNLIKTKIVTAANLHLNGSLELK